MKGQFFAFALCAITFALASCQAPCNHTPIDFGYNDSVHWAIYDCDNCDIDPRLDPHVDDDADFICDVCGYERESNGEYYTLTMKDEEWLYEPIAKHYVAGEEVTVKIKMAQDLGYLFVVNGKKIPCAKSVDGLYWEFVFTMPEKASTVDFKTYGGFLPDANYQVLIESYWLNNLSQESVGVQKYYGEYASGALVAIMGGASTTTEVWTETIALYPFTYPNGNYIEVFYNGEFYTLSQAYQNKHLTFTELGEIYQKHKSAYKYLYTK